MLEPVAAGEVSSQLHPVISETQKCGGSGPKLPSQGSPTMAVPSLPWGARHVAHTQEDPSRTESGKQQQEKGLCGVEKWLIRAAVTWSRPHPLRPCAALLRQMRHPRPGLNQP